MWKALKDVISVGNIFCPRENIQQLLDLDDEITTVESEIQASPILAKMFTEENEASQQADLLVLKNAVSTLEGIQLRANTKDENNVDEFNFTDEWLLFITRMTLHRDRWYETQDKIYKPHPFNVYISCLFYLQMTLRCRRRWKLIMEIPDSEKLLASESGTLPPIFCTFEDFAIDPRQSAQGSWFVVYDKAEPANKPIREWTPWEVYQALQYLIISRTMGGYDFSSTKSRENFLLYREALFDRVAMLCLFEIPGNPTQLAAHRPHWFTRAKRISVDDLPAVAVGGEEYKLISAKIREEQQKKTQEVIEQMKLDGTYDEEKDKINKAATSNEERTKRMVDDYEVTRVKELKSYVERLRNRIIAMDIDVEDLGEYKDLANEIDNQDLLDDLREKERLEKEIKDTESAIKILTLKYEEKLRAMVQENKNKLKAAVDIELKQGTEQLLETSMCRPEFIQTMMFMVDSVASWQLPMTRDAAYIPRFTAEFLAVYDKMYGIICESVLHANRVNFMRDAQNWIVSMRIQPCERQLYRQFHATGAKFNHLQVCQSVRDPLAIKLKNFELQSLDVMLSNKNHPFHADMLNFATWWTVVQLLNNVNVDTSLINWEYEADFVALNRAIRCKTETVVRIGGEYCLQLRGGWTYGEQGSLNVYWGTTNLLHAISFWILRRLADKKWKIYDRAGGVTVDITNTMLVEKFS